MVVVAGRHPGRGSSRGGVAGPWSRRRPGGRRGRHPSRSSAGPAGRAACPAAGGRVEHRELAGHAAECRASVAGRPWRGQPLRRRRRRPGSAVARSIPELGGGLGRAIAQYVTPRPSAKTSARSSGRPAARASTAAPPSEPRSQQRRRQLETVAGRLPADARATRMRIASPAACSRRPGRTTRRSGPRSSAAMMPGGDDRRHRRPRSRDRRATM